MPDGSRPLRVLYSQGEAALALGMSTKRLVEKVRDGELRYVLDGKRRKFLLSDLEAYALARRQPEWAYTAAPIHPIGGGRSRSKIVDFASLAGRRKEAKRSA